jgi:hypothetical protein
VSVIAAPIYAREILRRPIGGREYTGFPARPITSLAKPGAKRRLLDRQQQGSHAAVP